MPQHLRLTAVLALSATLVVGMPLAAAAVDPVSLESSHVLDEADALSAGEEATVQDAVTALYDDTGRDLFVVYVDSFSNPSDPAGWANAVASKNGLGPSDYLLAVAVSDRAYYLSADESGPVSFDDIGKIEQQNIEPKLHGDDWAGAAVAAAEGISGSIAGEAPAGTGWLIALGLIIVVGVILLVVVLVRRGKRRRAKQESLDELHAEASRALVQSDDAVRTAEQDLGFAVAQYGEKPVESYRAAIAQAKSQLGEAFALQQTLDDAVPDTDDEKRAAFGRILEICAGVGAALAEQEASFDELDALAQNVEHVLGSAESALSTLEGRIPGAQSLRDSLRSSYAETAVTAAADNPEQAGERAQFARGAIETARAHADAGEKSDAAVALRDAQRATAQGEQLLDALERQRDDLAAAAAEVQRLLGDLDADVAAARAQSSEALAGIAAATESALSDAREQLSSPGIDPVQLVARLTDVNARMDAALKQVRDAAEAERRARASLGSALSVAQSQVSAAEGFITARRGAVGSTARTRLAEANRLLVEASTLERSDPTAALSSAQRSASLAQQSLSSAQGDISGFGTDGGFGGLGGIGGSYSSGYARRSSNSALLGAVIGGLLSSGGSSRGFGGGYSSRGRSSFGGGRSFGGGGRSRRGGGRF